MSTCKSDFDFCEHCLYGKQNQAKFPFGATRAKEILELIHCDMFGHIFVPSLGGYLYYVIFIDDLSRYLVVFIEKEIIGFQQIQGLQGFGGKPNKKEDKGFEN